MTSKIYTPNSGSNTIYVGAIPIELRLLPQWVGWKYEARGGKPTKVPVDPRSGFSVDVTVKRLFFPFDETIISWISGKVDGVGFVFLLDDPYAGIDLDQVRDHLELFPWLEVFRSYAEWSPSGNGIHIIVRAKKRTGRCKKGQIEVYDRARYFTVTGQVVAPEFSGIRDCQAELDRFIAKVFGDIPEPSLTELLPEITPSAKSLNREKLELAFSLNPLLVATWRGQRRDLPSASEEDLSIASFLAHMGFRDQEIAEAIFLKRQERGQDIEKSQRLDYLKRTIAKTKLGGGPPIRCGLRTVEFNQSERQIPTVSADEVASWRS